MRTIGVAVKAGRWIVLLIVGVAMIGAVGCQTSTPQNTSSASLNEHVAICLPSDLRPPQDAIRLKHVDTSQAHIALPVHQRLLIVAYQYKGNAERCDDDTEYVIGLLDMDAQQFIEINRVRSYPPVELIWKPDGTQFILNSRGIGFGAASTWVFRADGEALFDDGYSASWVGNGDYVDVFTCRTPNSSGGGMVNSVYDTSSWQRVCQRCSGIGAAMECYGECSSDCPPGGTLAPITETQTPEHTTAHIEGYWLRITDTSTGAEQTYTLPGYRIERIAWSPG